MKVVSHTTIDNTLATMELMEEGEMNTLVQTFADEQPAIMTFLMAQEQDFSESDFDILIHLTLVIFMSFKNECGRMRNVQIDEVEAFEQRQLEHLNYLESLDEYALEEEMAATIDNAKQPFLLEYVTEELASREEEGEIEDKSGGAYLFPPLQLLIDLFDSAANSSFLKIV